MNFVLAVLTLPLARTAGDCPSPLSPSPALAGVSGPSTADFIALVCLGGETGVSGEVAGGEGIGLEEVEADSALAWEGGPLM